MHFSFLYTSRDDLSILGQTCQADKYNTKTKIVASHYSPITVQFHLEAGVVIRHIQGCDYFPYKQEQDIRVATVIKQEVLKHNQMITEVTLKNPARAITGSGRTT